MEILYKSFIKGLRYYHILLKVTSLATCSGNLRIHLVRVLYAYDYKIYFALLYCFIGLEKVKCFKSETKNRNKSSHEIVGQQVKRVLSPSPFLFAPISNSTSIYH